jgi:ATP-binding cassette, subfamily B, bacterial PglK
METTVGERGMRLSGGQRQRIGIARALYSEPLLLILDEATSALDNETERRISRTIADLHGHATILIVAHRLSTVRNCDRIVFMKDGRVAATGTFESLQAESAEFATLVQLGSLQS